MSERRTFSGKTLDEALEAATREFRRPREEIQYRVLVEKKSLFGLAKMVTIEVTEENAPPIIKTVLNKLIVSMNLNLSYNVNCEDRMVQVELSGDDLGLVLCRNGELLDAFQNILIQASKRVDWDGKINVDADDFRRKLRQKLQRMARKTAEKVKRDGKPQKLEYMPPHLRKIVHLSLAKSKDVMTHSEGDGYLKKVIIAPQRD